MKMQVQVELKEVTEAEDIGGGVLNFKGAACQSCSCDSLAFTRLLERLGGQVMGVAGGAVGKGGGEYAVRKRERVGQGEEEHCSGRGEGMGSNGRVAWEGMLGEGEKE